MISESVAVHCRPIEWGLEVEKGALVPCLAKKSLEFLRVGMADKEVLEFDLHTNGRDTFLDDRSGSYLNCSTVATAFPSVLTELPKGFQKIMSIWPGMAFLENPMINRVCSGRTPVSIGEIVEDLNHG